MKTKTLLLVNLMCALSIVFFSTQARAAQTQDKKPSVSDAEGKAATAIQSAPDVATKLAAAGEFLKTYPKSILRVQIAGYLAGQVGSLTDAAQRLSHIETLQKMFTEDAERAAINPIVIFSYVEAKKIDEAFALAAPLLAKDPENVFVLAQLNEGATNEAKRQNSKYLAQGMQHGLKAIEVIEANRKPTTMEEAAWAEEKKRLPRLYQNLGVLSLVSGKVAEAKSRLEKAAALDPTNPFNYALLANIANDEYAKSAQSYQALPAGPEKEKALKAATDQLDKVVEIYARAAALSEGRPEFKQLHDQVIQDLTPYYKFRNNGSAEGLQQFIDKYKIPAKP